MMAEKGPEKEDIRVAIKDIKRSNRVFAVMILGLVMLFAGLLLNMYFNQVPASQTPTFDELYNATLNGYESENNYLYNGYVFIREDMLWKTLVQRKDAETFLLSTHYAPRDVENISAAPGLRNIIQTKDHIALVATPDLTARSVTGIYDVGRIIGNRFNFLNKETTLALTEGNGSVPVVTCNNVSEAYGVIRFSLGNETAIRVDDGCVLVTGTSEEDIVRTSDRLLFTLLQMIPEQQPMAAMINISARSADWKGGPAHDGLVMAVHFMDEEGQSVSPEGSFKVVAAYQDVTLETWEFPLTLQLYNHTGVADLRLGTNISEWPGNVDIHIGFQQLNGRPIKAMLTLS